MSEVLIKGIGIPESCAECRFCVNGFTDNAPMYECACQSYDNVSVLVDDHGQPFDFRPEWCPLVEVPTPHGDLVDRNYLISEYDRQHKGPAGGARRIMEDAPTIIEEERSDNG